MLCNQHHEQGTHICVTEQEQQRNKHLAAQALKQQNRALGIELELNGSSTQNKDRPLNPGRTNRDFNSSVEHVNFLVEMPLKKDKGA